MIYWEYPKLYCGEYEKTNRTVFLAGGIRYCPDWRKEIRHELISTRLILLSPVDPNLSEIEASDAGHLNRSVRWGYHHRKIADAILFWFPKESLNSVVLYELGQWMLTGKPIFIGMDDEYKLKDVLSALVDAGRPQVQIQYSLKDLARRVCLWVECEEFFDASRTT